MTDDAPSVAVIGGGVTGLTAAYRLLQRGFRVRLLEAGDELGGLVRTFEVAGEPVECFYHHLFASDTSAVRLFDELGVGDKLEWRPSRVGMLREGRVYPFTSALDLLRFAPLRLSERIKLGLTAMRLRGERSGAQFEDITAAEWLRRELGEKTLDVVWAPLLRGKFGEMWEHVVMTWLWNKVRTRFSSRRGRWSRSEVLGHMSGSFGAWTSALVERLRDLGCEIETGAPVARIVSDRGRIGIERESETVSFDSVVATVSNDVIERIAPDLMDAYSAKLRGTRYQDGICLVLMLDRQLTDYYWLNINDPDVPFVALVEHTNLVDADRYGGRHIVYVSNYVDRDAPITREDADEVLRMYAPYLKRISPAFDESWVAERHLFHARDAQPVFTVGAGRRVPGHRTPVPGLYLANMAQIYPQDRGQNYAIERGEAVAEIVAEDLARGAAPHYQV